MIIQWGGWFRFYSYPRSFMLTVRPIGRLWVSWGGVDHFRGIRWWGVEVEWGLRRHWSSRESRWLCHWHWVHKVERW